MSSRPDGVHPVRAIVMVAAALTAALTLAARAASLDYKTPPETAAPAPGPNADLVSANCTVCHSFDYVITQPRSFADPTAFWTAEVNKMRTVFGAPVDAANVKPIVEYLAAVYGK